MTAGPCAVLDVDSSAAPLVLADGTCYDVRISVGVVWCDSTDSPASALARADAAMYRVEVARRRARAGR